MVGTCAESIVNVHGGNTDDTSFVGRTVGAVVVSKIVVVTGVIVWIGSKLLLGLCIQTLLESTTLNPPPSRRAICLSLQSMVLTNRFSPA